MIDHGRALDLAAAAMDWELTATERDALRAHLSTCESCRRADVIQHNQAAALRSLAHAETPVAVRRIVLSAASGDLPRHRSSTWTLLAAAALIALAAVGGAVGVYVLERTREEAVIERPSEPLPASSDFEPALPAPAPSPMSVARLEQLRWTSVPEAATVFEGAALSTVVAGETGLVAFGQARATLGTLVWVSPDGRAWESVPQPEDVFGGGVPTHVVAGGPGYVAIGWDISVENGTRRAAWTSPDGRTWTRDPDPDGQFGAVDIVGMASSDGVTVVLVSDPAGTEAMTVRSEDGLAWERLPAPASLEPGVSGVARGADGFIAFGSVEGAMQLWSSTDGRSWTAASVERDGTGEPGAGSSIERVVGTGTRVLAQGRLEAGRPLTMTSPDGRRWRMAPEAQRPGGEPTMAGGSGAFLAYLTPTAPAAPLVAWTSIDGESWVLLSNSPLESEPVAIEPAVTVSQAVPVEDGWVVLGYETATGEVLVWSIR